MISTQIERITNLRNRIRTKLLNLGLISASPRSGDNDLEDCTDAIEGISGTKQINRTILYDVAGFQYAQVNEPNLVTQNIAEGVTILGVTGSHSGSTPPQLTQSKEMLLGGPVAPSTVYPDSGYLLSEVYPSMVAQPTLIPENIKSGVTIMGVLGSYSIPTETNDTTVTVVNPRTMVMPVDFNNTTDLVCLNVDLNPDTLIDANKVFCVVSKRIQNNALYHGARYFDGSGRYQYAIASPSVSNGTLTIELPSNSAYTFVEGADKYNCYYTYMT